GQGLDEALGEADYFVVDVEVGFDHALPAVVLLNAAARVATEPLAQPFVRGQVDQRLGKAGNVAWRDEQAVVQVPYDLAGTADSGGDHREAAGHGFEHGERHAFRERRSHENVAVAQD